MNSIGYSVVLTRCMGLSAIGLLSGFVFPLPAAIPFTLGILPLFWYHLGYLRRHAGEGISQPAVDSVYYFGFLITIGALGATALRLGLYGVEGSFASVAMQFGLGLMATGYAVWARIHLTASSKFLDEANLEEAMNKYVERSRELVTNVELATSAFSAYSSTVIVTSEALARRLHDDAGAGIKDAAEVFRTSISGLSQEGKLALQSLRAVVNDVTFGSEREELRRSVSGMTDTVTSLTGTLGELKVSSALGASSIGEFASGLVSVGSGAKSAAKALSSLGDERGALPKVVASLEQSRIMLDELNLSADVAAISVTKFSDGLAGTAAAIMEFGTTSSKAAQTMNRISATTERVSALAESLGELEGEFKSLVSASGPAGQALSGMSAKIEELRAVLDNLNAALIDSTGGLKDAMLTMSDDIEARMRQTVASIDDYALKISKTGMTSTQTDAVLS